MARAKSSLPAELPPGLQYQPSFITAEEEGKLLDIIGNLEFHAFDFQRYTALRRIIEYGYEYDFTSRKASAAPAIPEFLNVFKERCAQWIGVAPQDIVESVITEYPAGAPIGWHRDVPQFEDIVGLSLGSACRMRFKPYKAAGKIASIILEPRSAYLMRGPSRWRYQHSIPAVEQLRYSITFRTLSALGRKGAQARPQKSA